MRKPVKPLTEPMKHDNAVSSAQFSPDGKRIVTVSDSTRVFGMRKAASR